MAAVFQRAVKFISLIEDAVKTTISFRYRPESFLPALVNSPYPMEDNSFQQKSLTEILKESFLWAVPKRRRTIEKRRCRRFGKPGYFYKPLVPKTKILICDECGSYKEAGLLCPNCYSKVKTVTREMQDAIKKDLGISPIENEVVVLYLDEEKSDPEYYKGKRIVEIKKSKPKLFSENLLQRSVEGPATTNEVIPKNDL